jgi:beta-phosphoglucomutase family hydrolase
MQINNLDSDHFKKFKALLFDCDGTLVNTMPSHYDSWKAILTKYNIPFDYEKFYKLAGVPTNDIVRLLAEENGKSLDASLISHEKDTFFHQNIEQVQPIHAVVNIARNYLGQKKMAVASGSSKWSVVELLKSVGILNWFPVISAAEDVKRPKPYPDVFLNAAHLLNVQPSECCVFEDAELGIQGAEAAGMTAINILKTDLINL